MECVWSLFGHRRPDGYSHKQDPAVFYVHFYPYYGLPDHYLYDPCLLEEYAPVYESRKT